MHLINFAVSGLEAANSIPSTSNTLYPKSDGPSNVHHHSRPSSSHSHHSSSHAPPSQNKQDRQRIRKRLNVDKPLPRPPQGAITPFTLQQTSSGAAWLEQSRPICVAVINMIVLCTVNKSTEKDSSNDRDIDVIIDQLLKPAEYFCRYSDHTDLFERELNKFDDIFVDPEDDNELVEAND